MIRSAPATTAVRSGHRPAESERIVAAERVAPGPAHVFPPSVTAPESVVNGPAGGFRTRSSRLRLACR
ncbi:predicted protein [Streptomyces viridosporus ATCC 14672]|uniref:Predicted protein n=1 Tax=Streptomyces viridosporus (strain ATCC 14672 / DSM 40746 / JCM 4963 / KCTC 9882 / NRRL B-12104 / FH 1290) TaxID=566461 RepID=D6A7F3_STRV1|nr:predicted protein [Streptomyces viridosporus ATCC 14672]